MRAVWGDLYFFLVRGVTAALVLCPCMVPARSWNVKYNPAWLA
jgi:hypothetical protein